jgi:hypothetical protein
VAVQNKWLQISDACNVKSMDRTRNTAWIGTKRTGRVEHLLLGEVARDVGGPGDADVQRVVAVGQVAPADAEGTVYHVVPSHRGVGGTINLHKLKSNE